MDKTSNKTSNKTKALEVNITYARVALMLLALNLLGTGYALAKITASNDAVIEESTPPTVDTAISDEEKSS